MMRSYFVSRIQSFVFLVEIHVVRDVFYNHLVVMVNEMFLGRFRDIALSMLRGSKVIIGVFFIVGDGIPAHFGDFHALTRTTIALPIWRGRGSKSW